MPVAIELVVSQICLFGYGVLLTSKLVAFDMTV